MKTKSNRITNLVGVTFDEFRHAYKEATGMMLDKIVTEGAYETSLEEREHAKVLLSEYRQWKAAKK